MNKEQFIEKWNVAFEDLEQKAEFDAEMLADLDSLSQPKEQLTPEEIFNVVTSNGMREMTKERFIQALAEYSNQPKPSEESNQIKEEIISKLHGISVYLKLDLNADIAKDLDEAIELLEKLNQSKWISVKDRLPEDDAQVLVYDEDSEIIYAHYNSGYYGYEGFIMAENGGEYITELNVTHWQPLPKAP